MIALREEDKKGLYILLLIILIVGVLYCLHTFSSHFALFLFISFVLTMQKLVLYHGHGPVFYVTKCRVEIWERAICKVPLE